MAYAKADLDFVWTLVGSSIGLVELQTSNRLSIVIVGDETLGLVNVTDAQAEKSL